MTLTSTILWTVFAGNGGCSHIEQLSYTQVAFVLKLTWISQAFSSLAACFGEMSVSFFVLRIIGKTNEWKQRVLWSIIFLTFLLTVVTCILLFAQCRPVSALWWPGIVNGSQCWDPSIFMNWAVFTNGKHSNIAGHTLNLISVQYIGPSSP